MSVNRQKYPTLDTPAILLDLDKLEANIDEMAQLAKRAGLKLAPHSKCHKSPDICKMQINAEAIGVTVSKLSEAEVLAEKGINSIEIVHPIYGDHKFKRFKPVLILRSTGTFLLTASPILESSSACSIISTTIV